MDGCWKSRDGVETPHCFQFVRGRQLTDEQKRMLDDICRPQDVYCCVKTYIRDVKLMQPPLLVCGSERRNRLANSGPQAILARQPFGEAKIKTLTKLAGEILRSLENKKASDAILDYVHGQRVRTVPQLSWLQLMEHSCLGLDLPEPVQDAYFPHLPEVSFKMKVKFKQ